jgi:hypothetical protein
MVLRNMFKIVRDNPNAVSGSISSDDGEEVMTIKQTWCHHDKVARL